jgi:selenocysteine-specific translation elongation factor
MGNLKVAIVGPNGYAAGIGKKSETTDITSYDNKKGEVTFSVIEPTGYPEKLASLFYSASMADSALVVVEKLDASFGESALMLDCAGVKNGYIVLRGGMVMEQIAPLIKGLVLEGYAPLQDNPTAIREKLMEDAENLEPNESLKMTVSAGSVPIDQFFNVKGVGTVVLGNVAEGVVKRHDRLKALPGGKAGEVRSIQKHDDEFDWSAKGDRVGLALKGLEVTDLDRGMVLTNNPSLKSELAITVDAKLTKYWPKPLEEGMVLHVGHWMQFLSSRVETVKDDGDWKQPTVKLALDKPLVHLSGDRAVLSYLDGGKLRVAGSFTLP